jgi:hypothetical protein
MVTKTAVNRRIEIDLESLRLMLGDLPEVAEDWARMGEGERVSWSLDWDQVMGGVQVTLDPPYRAGEMTPDQRARYRDLLRELAAALPVIERLQLQPPSVPLPQ